jgi:hypothetical protein
MQSKLAPDAAGQRQSPLSFWRRPGACCADAGRAQRPQRDDAPIAQGGPGEARGGAELHPDVREAFRTYASDIYPPNAGVFLLDQRLWGEMSEDGWRAAVQRARWRK